ncbi:hypothetical protein ABZS66_01770 [Dactylosporangium sp. NPDC005572]
MAAWKRVPADAVAEAEQALLAVLKLAVQEGGVHHVELLGRR